MATCTQIDLLLQAYVDGELNRADRLIVDQHVSECRSCSEALREQQRLSAYLFETLRADRLQRDLRQPVLDHLPEMDRLPLDVETVNWRVKHPVSIWARIGRGVPVAVGVVLLLVAAVLRYEWPQNTPGERVIGMVMQVDGKALRHPDSSTDVEAASVSDFVEAGDRFETGASSSMMLTLAGPTEVKLDENTIIRVADDRWVNVVRGRIWLDVSKDERFFRVRPPVGEITVLGTCFDVNVLPDKTRVTVSEGQVHVENEGAVSLVTEGQQVDMIPGATRLVPWNVDASSVMQWASAIGPAAEARVAFEEHIVPRTEGKLLRAEQVFMLPRNGGSTSIKSIEVQWTPDEFRGGHCDYWVYVTNSRNDLVFKNVIPGRVFSDKSNTSYKLQIPEGTIQDFRVLYIRVVPDFSTGTVETAFKSTIMAETR